MRRYLSVPTALCGWLPCLHRVGGQEPPEGGSAPLYSAEEDAFNEFDSAKARLKRLFAAETPEAEAFAIFKIMLEHVERLLREAPPPERELQITSSMAEQYSLMKLSQQGVEHQLFRPFAIVKFLLQAFTAYLRRPHLNQRCHATGTAPSWIYYQEEAWQRALHISHGGCLPGGCQTLEVPRDLLEALPRKWPRVNALPRRVLAGMHCPMQNVSLASLLVFDGRNKVASCRPSLARFDALAYRSAKAKGVRLPDLFSTLHPHLLTRPVFLRRASHMELLRAVLEEHVLDPTGLFLEFGVAEGASLNAIAQRLRALGGGTVYGFDSFKGLPEAWHGAGQVEGFERRSTPGTAHGDQPAGAFRVEGLPQVEANAKLVVGLFNKTLPKFLRQVRGEGPLRLLHLDADLYSSTRHVFEAIGSMIAPGCIIVMDDLVNFPGFRGSGMRALGEFLQSPKAPFSVEVLAAPWNIYLEDDLKQEQGHWEPGARLDLERAVAFRVL